MNKFILSFLILLYIGHFTSGFAQISDNCRVPYIQEMELHYELQRASWLSYLIRDYDEAIFTCEKEKSGYKISLRNLINTKEETYFNYFTIVDSKGFPSSSNILEQTKGRERYTSRTQFGTKELIVSEKGKGKSKHDNPKRYTDAVSLILRIIACNDLEYLKQNTGVSTLYYWYANELQEVTVKFLKEEEIDIEVKGKIQKFKTCVFLVHQKGNVMNGNTTVWILSDKGSNIPLKAEVRWYLFRFNVNLNIAKSQHPLWM